MEIARTDKKPTISRENLNKIINRLSSKEIESIIIYGSQLSGGVSKNSDLDLLVVIKRLDEKIIKKLIQGKIDLEKIINLEISLNVHTKDELDPLLKKKNIFMHKNRSEFLIYKYKYHYLCIYGKNPFKFFEDPSPKQIREEAIKLLLSFSYNLKKFILNPALAPHKEKEFIRTLLISLEYIAAFYGYVSRDKYDALRYLKENKLIKGKDIRFIQEVSPKEKLTFREKIKVIKFIDFYRGLLVKDYLTFAQSDIRYLNGKIKLHWDLKYPQAVSMAIVLYNHKILLVKRTKDDYIYPDRWTLPGGYLENKESFEDCIKRELLEETSLTKYKITSLFNNKKIKTKRVAIGCFLINPDDNKIKLAEHSNFNFFNIKEINKLQLTPESKKVLEKYLNQ